MDGDFEAGAEPEGYPRVEKPEEVEEHPKLET